TPDSSGPKLFGGNIGHFIEIKPKKLIEPLEEEGWVLSMTEELNQFERNKSAKKQQLVAMSSAEAEYVAAYGFCTNIVFKFPPYPFNYPTRRLTIEEMLAKFIDGGKREHEEMKIFIKEFRTTNELLLEERSNLVSEMEIKVNKLSKVMGNVLVTKNKVKGVTTRGGKMTSSKEINETKINKNKPPRFEQDVQEKPHDDGVENKSSSIPEKTTQPLEEACTETMNERCSAILLNELPLKEKDLRSFAIPCQVLEKHKEAKDLAADHLSRFENPHMEVLTQGEIVDKLSNKHLMVLKSKFNNDEPWFFSQVKNYFWEEPYAFKLCADNIMRRCVAGSETLKILAHCHSRPTGGHHSASVTAKEVYKFGFYWPSIFKDANEYVRRCDACQRSGYISSRNKMP
nr:reverse transcriptase domain-containing protein [Tanacetum cinerariifolium]